MERHHYRFQRITVDPNKCFGKPCIRGLRIPVASILSYLSAGMTVEEILAEWPDWSRRIFTKRWALPRKPWKGGSCGMEEITNP